MSKPTVKPGDVLYWAIPRGNNCDVTVTKVGRKWITCNVGTWREERFCVDTWQNDGGDFGLGRYGQLYASKAEWEAEFALEREWGEFFAKVRNTYSRPAGVTSETIKTLLAEMSK